MPGLKRLRTRDCHGREIQPPRILAVVIVNRSIMQLIPVLALLRKHRRVLRSNTDIANAVRKKALQLNKLRELFIFLAETEATQIVPHQRPHCATITQPSFTLTRCLRPSRPTTPVTTSQRQRWVEGWVSESLPKPAVQTKASNCTLILPSRSNLLVSWPTGSR